MERALADELEDVARERRAAGAAPDADAHGTTGRALFLSVCWLSRGWLVGWLVHQAASTAVRQRVTGSLGCAATVLQARIKSCVTENNACAAVRVGLGTQRRATGSHSIIKL